MWLKTGIVVIGSILLTLVVLLLGGAQSAGGKELISDRVGVARCRGCHEQEYQIWSKTAHARAVGRLSEAEQRNPLCLRCHTTGTSFHLRGVQCESCHGSGRYYAQHVVMRDPKLARAVFLRVVAGKQGCLRCHQQQSPKLRPFDYGTMWKKIAHRRARSGRGSRRPYRKQPHKSRRGRR